MIARVGSSVVVVLELGGWDVAEFAVEAPVVEPVDVGEGGQFDVLGVTPGALAADQLSLVEPVHSLGEALSNESPMQPIEGSAWISARRSV